MADIAFALVCGADGSWRAPRVEIVAASRFSEAEAQSDRGIDVVALEKAISQCTIHFREHQTGVEIPLRCKPPINNARDRVERPGALCMLGTGAGQGARGGGAEVGVLGVMV